MESAQPIAEIASPIDAGQFLTDVVPAHRPVVIRGLCSEWPLVDTAGNGTDALLAAIRRSTSNEPVGVFMADPSLEGRYFYDESLTGFNFERGQIPLHQLLDELERLQGQDEPPGLYAGAIPLNRSQSALADAHPMSLLPDDTERLTSLWLGNAGRTATHWDLPHNIAVVVAGERRFTLFPPDQYANLYVGPIDRTLAGQPVSLVDPAAPDLDKYPRFVEAMKHAITATLLPGDAIFVPTLWFHHVVANAPVGALMNFWWRDAAPHMLTPLTTLLHAFLTLRDLPQAERQLWRAMFDHYVFDSDESTHAHIPESARGFLGDITPERAQRLRAFLIASLGGKI